MRGLITANLKVLGTYPNDNDELIIAKRGSMTSGSSYFSSLDEIGSNIHVVGLDQGSSNLTLEVQSTAEFSSNPDQTHLSVIF